MKRCGDRSDSGKKLISFSRCCFGMQLGCLPSRLGLKISASHLMDEMFRDLLRCCCRRTLSLVGVGLASTKVLFFLNSIQWTTVNFFRVLIKLFHCLAAEFPYFVCAKLERKRDWDKHGKCDGRKHFWIIQDMQIIRINKRQEKHLFLCTQCCNMNASIRLRVSQLPSCLKARIRDVSGVSSIRIFYLCFQLSFRTWWTCWRSAHVYRLETRVFIEPQPALNFKLFANKHKSN